MTFEKQAEAGPAPPPTSSSLPSAAKPVQLRQSNYADQAAEMSPSSRPGFDSQQLALRPAAIAAEGVADAGSSLPHLDAIQRSFGPHDVSAVKFHQGAASRDANRALGSRAFAMDNHVASDGATDLHTVAHEAAHVVQQRGGVQLKGGIGAANDRYEQHADAVADRVVKGQSAKSLLDTMAPTHAHAGSSSGDAVQRKMMFTGLGDRWAYLMGISIRHAFSKFNREIRLLEPEAHAVCAAVAAPAAMPNAVERMMAVGEDHGTYDLEDLEDIKLLYQVFKRELSWQQYLGGTTRGKMRQGAQAHRKGDYSRVPLREEEEGRSGYAQLPLLHKWDEHDEANKGRLKHFEGGSRTAVLYRLLDGKLVAERDASVLNTTESKMGYADMHRAMTDVAEEEGVDLMKADDLEFGRIQDLAKQLGGTQIYVMNAAGDIFAAKEKVDIIHHSSFLAGGAIAGAGTIRTTSDGAINFISNKSGHYEPGPAYLWQVLRNMQRHAVDLAGIKIWVLGVKGQFASAAQFYGAFNPSQDPRYFDTEWAVAQLDTYLGNL